METEWEIIPCEYCVGGFVWEGNDVTCCERCDNTGVYYLHVPSGCEAVYPGGKFIGKRKIKKVVNHE